MVNIISGYCSKTTFRQCPIRWGLKWKATTCPGIYLKYGV